MSLSPFLPILADESLASYLARVAKFHADMDLGAFLRFIELSQSSLMKPDGNTIARLSSLLDVSCLDLEKMTFISLGGRKRKFRGEEVHAEFANLDMTSFCPACLLDDAKSGVGAKGGRIGRVIWMIEHYRTCEKHQIGLVRRKNTALIEKLQVMSEVAPDDAALSRLVYEATPQRVSNLQRYVMRRLAGERGPEWLDDQPIDVAARACEMLGVISTAGTHANLKLLTDADWNEAGHVGFGYACRGKSGVEGALRAAKRRFEQAGLKGGPQKALGRLYQWLQFSKNSKPTGPVRTIVREFILNNFPIEVGTNLLGEVVDVQRVHNVHSLAKLTGDHPKTINRALVLSGLMDGDPDKVRGNMVCDAKQAETLMRRIQNSLPVTRLPNYLNCNRIQAEQLVRRGIIPRLLNDSQRATGRLKQVAIEDVDNFMNRFLAAAEKKKAASENVMDLVAASEIARWPVLDIVSGILDGLFETVEVVDPSLNFKGILVDPLEVRDVLSSKMAEGRVGIDEAARLIGMPKSGLSSLAKLKTADDEPYIREHWFENSKGAKIRVFQKTDLEHFRSQHISLKEIAEAALFSPKVMKMKLDARGLEPIAPQYELGRIWYRRCEVPSF